MKLKVSKNSLIEIAYGAIFIDIKSIEIVIYLHPKHWTLWAIWGSGDIGSRFFPGRYFMFRALFFAVWKNLKLQRGDKYYVEASNS